MNWRIIKESFPMVVSSLVGGNAEWKGMDDMTPFWQTRRIMQDLPPHVHKTWSPATCSPPLNRVRSALSPSLSMFCVPVFLVPALLVCLLCLSLSHAGLQAFCSPRGHRCPLPHLRPRGRTKIAGMGGQQGRAGRSLPAVSTVLLPAGQPRLRASPNVRPRELTSCFLHLAHYTRRPRGLPTPTCCSYLQPLRTQRPVCSTWSRGSSVAVSNRRRIGTTSSMPANTPKTLLGWQQKFSPGSGLAWLSPVPPCR